MFTSYAIKDPMRSKHDIKITDIDKELHKLWDSLEASHKVRACLFTLVLYTDDGTRVEHFKDLVKEIIEFLPCRIIFISGDHDLNNNFLRTSVSALTSGHGDQMIACDQITIEAGGEYLRRVPFVVTPHLVADLPVYMVWGQDPTKDHEILPYLEKYATRIIFDSECSNCIHSFARTVLDHVRVMKCEVADLNWARAKGWRDVLTQIFNTPGRIYQLANARRLSITFNNKKSDDCRHPDVQALYLQGWLAARLNWKFQSFEKIENNLRITYQNSSGKVTVVLHPEFPDDLPPGSIIKVAMERNGDHFISAAREGKTRSVTVNVATPQHCEIPYTLLLSPLQRGQQLMKEIFYEPASEHYVSMLKSIAEVNLEI